MNRLFFTLCLLALVRISGLDLAIAQVDAWASMIKERASSNGIELAIQSTFSGKAPCEKCLSIKHEKDEREDTPADSLYSLEKFKLPLAPARPLPSVTYCIYIPLLSPTPRRLKSLCTMEVLSPPPQVG